LIDQDMVVMVRNRR